jgi:hypothetical protein
VLKVLAFKCRGDNKDAYDICFVLKNYGKGLEDVYRHLAPLLKDDIAKQALEVLKNDFVEPDATGPVRAAEFLYGTTNIEFQADVAGVIRQLLFICENRSIR